MEESIFGVVPKCKDGKGVNELEENGKENEQRP
jgi:hypothetical protein